MKHPPSAPDAKRTAVTKAALDQTAIDLAICREQVSKRAYFTYLNEGAPEGRAVRHWLDAEDEFIRERNLTRKHGFPNET